MTTLVNATVLALFFVVVCSILPRYRVRYVLRCSDWFLASFLVSKNLALGTIGVKAVIFFYFYLFVIFGCVAA